MGKNKNKSKFGMLSVKAGIDNNPEPTQADRIVGAQGAAQFGIIKHLNAGGNISELLKSKPGSQSVLKPNRSVNNMSNMVRQQPRQLMGMDVSTNAQILNQAYDPRMAVNNMQGPAQAGMVPGNDFVSEITSNVTKKPKTRSQKRLEKTKAKAEKARKETTSKETADKGVVGDGTRSKTQQKRAKTKRLEKRAKRQEGRQERKEIRKKAREGKMTRGEKRNAIIDSRDKQKGKGPAQYQVPNPNEKSKKPEPKLKQKSREERRNEEKEKQREDLRKKNREFARERMEKRMEEERKKRNKEAAKKGAEARKKRK